MMEQTGCDGVMIGIGALGNPWVFKESGRPEDMPSMMRGVHRHLELIDHCLFPTDRLLGLIKNHIGRYFKLLPGSSNFRKLVYESESYAQLKEKLDSLSQKS